MSKPLTDRNREIVLLAKLGHTFEGIAKMTGVTKQRAHYIFKREKNKLSPEELLSTVKERGSIQGGAIERARSLTSKH